MPFFDIDCISTREKLFWEDYFSYIKSTFLSHPSNKDRENRKDKVKNKKSKRKIEYGK